MNLRFAPRSTPPEIAKADHRAHKLTLNVSRQDYQVTTAYLPKIMEMTQYMDTVTKIAQQMKPPALCHAIQRQR